jgi:hypothetical protein
VDASVPAILTEHISEIAIDPKMKAIASKDKAFRDERNSKQAQNRAAKQQQAAEKAQQAEQDRPLLEMLIRCGFADKTAKKPTNSHMKDCCKANRLASGSGAAMKQVLSGALQDARRSWVTARGKCIRLSDSDDAESSSEAGASSLGSSSEDGDTDGSLSAGDNDAPLKAAGKRQRATPSWHNAYFVSP